MDTPVGTLLLAATERGLVRVAYEARTTTRCWRRSPARISPRILLAPARLDDVARQLDEYFAGGGDRFDLRAGLPAGRRASGAPCSTTCAEIAYGRTESYAQVAAAAGSPRAVRAVGTACATNPLPVVVPCHRVVRSDGGLGGYAGGLLAKQTLLALEGRR